MQKYEKPIARNLGDLQPALGLCIPGQSARPGSGDYCINGDAASYLDGTCDNGNYARGDCDTGNSPNYSYPY